MYISEFGIPREIRGRKQGSDKVGFFKGPENSEGEDRMS